jgi:hypothetical protein
MEHKRIRKFQYETEYHADSIAKLKSIDCKYHIFGIDDNNFLKGYIFFTNPKTVLKIKKQFNSNCKIDESVFTIDTYRELDNVWESGVLPLQGRPKKTAVKVISNELVPATHAIIEQNTSLIEQSKEICQYLMKQNQQLLEENKQCRHLIIVFYAQR